VIDRPTTRLVTIQETETGEGAKMAQHKGIELIPPHDRRALVAGASSGLGETYARRLADAGFDLLLVARRESRLAKLASELRERPSIRVETVAADLSTEPGVDSVLRSMREDMAPTFLVYSAGFGTRRLFVDIPAGRPAQMVYLHNVAPVRLARAALPHMIERGYGGLVLISSLASFFTTARYTTYSATKAFINTFCEGLHAELADEGVSVQALCPGLTRTEFFSTRDFEGFDYPHVPPSAWMDAEEVVDESLARLKDGGPVVIPGRQNRMFVRLMTAPLLGKMILAALDKVGSERSDLW
jgi:short-subunit dehydrogenase